MHVFVYRHTYVGAYVRACVSVIVGWKEKARASEGARENEGVKTGGREGRRETQREEDSEKETDRQGERERCVQCLHRTYIGMGLFWQ